MEEQSIERSGMSAGSNQATPVAWQDLREWIALVEANGLLKRIDAPVDADEELAAIAYLATRREDAPALLFDNITGDRTGASILANMLGSSKERYALAVGPRPDPLHRRDDRGDPRDHAAADQAGADRESQGAASTRSCCAATRSISRNSRCRNSGRATAAATSAPATSR